MTTPDIDIDHLRGWIGRSETSDDVLNLEHAHAIAATLDHTAAPGPGDPLIPLWHWAWFRPTARARDIGADGHPRLGAFLPPVPLPRRMWVGGEVNFIAPPRIGARISRTTRITDVVAKTGSAPMRACTPSVVTKAALVRNSDGICAL